MICISLKPNQEGKHNPANTVVKVQCVKQLLLAKATLTPWWSHQRSESKVTIKRGVTRAIQQQGVRRVNRTQAITPGTTQNRKVNDTVFFSESFLWIYVGHTAFRLNILLWKIRVYASELTFLYHQHNSGPFPVKKKGNPEPLSSSSEQQLAIYFPPRMLPIEKISPRWLWTSCG